MILVLALVVVIVALYLSGCFSGAETGLYCVNRLQVQLGVDQKDRRAIRLHRFCKDEQGALSVLLIGTNLMNYIVTATSTFVLAEHFHLSDERAEIVAVAILTPLVFVFGEVTPKNLFQRRPNESMLRHSALLHTAKICFGLVGVVRLLKLLASTVTRFLGDSFQESQGQDPRNRVAMMLRDAMMSGEEDEEQSDLVSRVLSLSTTMLHAVMRPRNEILAVSAEADRRELIAIARRTAHHFVPVYDRDPRRIIGSIKIDALLVDNGWEHVADRMLKVPSFGAHETVATALAAMQRTRRPMAIVIDRGGLMLGIVYLKELLQESIVKLES